MPRILNTVGAAVTVEWSSGEQPASATLTVTRPDGVELDPAPTVSRETSGVCVATFTATQPGLYKLLWNLGPQGVHADVVDVWPESPRLLVSVEDALKRVSAAAPIATNDKVAMRESLRLYIAAATWVVEAVVGKLLPEPKTFTVSGRWNKRQIAIPGNCTAVTSVTVDGTELTEGDDYKVDTLAWIVIGDALACDGDLNVVIAYQVGAAAIPPPARQACLEIVAHMWNTRRSTRDGATGDDTVTTSVGFAVPRRANELLQAVPRMPEFG